MAVGRGGRRCAPAPEGICFETALTGAERKRHRAWRENSPGCSLSASVFHRSSRQIEPPADAGSTTLAKRDPCRRNILHATAARIEDYEFVLRHAPTFSACREVGKFG